MRVVWVDAGNGIDFGKVSRHGLTGAFFSLTNGDGSAMDPPESLQQRLLDVRNANLAAGVYMAWNWPIYAGLSGAQVAEHVHQQIAATIKYPKPAWPKVQFDIEAHDPDFILAVLRRFRELRPTQDVSWTMESFQGGWMSPAFAQEIVNLKVRVVPQLYLGQMAQIELRESNPAKFWKQIADQQVAQDMALRDLTRRGFPENLITGFYDGAALPARYDGFIFTQGRLL